MCWHILNVDDLNPFSNKTYTQFSDARLNKISCLREHFSSRVICKQFSDRKQIGAYVTCSFVWSAERRRRCAKLNNLRVFIVFFWVSINADSLYQYLRKCRLAVWLPMNIFVVSLIEQCCAKMQVRWPVALLTIKLWWLCFYFIHFHILYFPLYIFINCQYR